MLGGDILSPVHLALVVLALLLVFGARRLPEIGRSLGGGIREFKQSLSGQADSSAELTAPQAASQAFSQTAAANGAPVAEQQPAEQQPERVA